MNWNKQLSLTFLLFCFPLLLTAQLLLPIKKDGKWGAINESGKLVIPPQYDFIGSFTEITPNEQPLDDSENIQWASFRKDGKVGVLDATGKIVLEAIYQQVAIIPNQRIVVWQDGKCGLMDENAKQLIAPEYDHIDQLDYQLFKLTFKNKIGIADMDGKLIHTAIFDKVDLFSENSVIATVQQNGKFGLLNELGELILNTEYDKIDINQLSAIATKGKTITVIKVDELGAVLNRQDYTNQIAYDMAAKKADRLAKQKIVADDPGANKPTWIKDGFRYKLVDIFGRNLLRKEFFSLNVDDETNLSLGILETEEKKLECYLIAHQEAKILLKKEVKDMVLSDFRTSNYARITLDTLWDGLVNKSGEVIDKIQGQDITNIGNYNSKRALVHIGNKFGFIDENAKLVIPLDYDIVSEFKEGVAIGRKAGKFGCLNPEGKAIIPFEFDGIGQPSNGLVRLKQGRGRTGKWALYTLDDKALTDFDYDLIDEFKNGEAIVRRAGKWGVINTQGKEIVPCSIQAGKLFPFSNGIAKIGNELIVENIGGVPKRRYKYNGYINRDGVEVIAPKYDYIFDFDSVWQEKEGLARIVNGNQVGYVDHTGKEVVAPNYSGIQDFEEAWMNRKGLAKIISADGQYGYIDYTGRQVLNPAFSSVENFAAVLADTNKWARASDKGKFGFINHRGETMISFVYDRISNFKSGAAIVKKGANYGLINRENELLIPIEYDGIRYLEGSEATLIKIYNKKPTIFMLDGKGSITDSYPASEDKNISIAENKIAKYKYLTDFDANGFAVIEANKLKGVASREGKIIIKPKYAQLRAFSEGLAAFQVSSKDRSKRKWGYLNLTGKEVIPATFNLASDFSDGKAAVNKRLWGYIDTGGKLIIPHKYRQAEAFSGGMAVVDQKIIINQTGNQVGIIGLTGKITSGFQSGRAVLQTTTGSLHLKPNGDPAYFQKFDEVTPFVGDIAFVKRGERWELTRKIGEHESKVQFTAAQRNSYLAEFGTRYKRKTPFGTLQDVKWEKVKDGFWRMIDKNGNLINASVYDKVTFDPVSATFKVQKDGYFGIANLKGEFITPPENDIIQSITKNVIRVESGGKIGYIRPDGTWIWELK